MRKKVKGKTWQHRCRQCGKCCIATNGSLGMITIHDIAIWISARRYDILEWIEPVIVPGDKVVAFDAWIDPETYDDVSECPWLEKSKEEGVYECAIHDVKPEICRNFPVNIKQGEKLGCPACQENSLCKPGQVNKVSKQHCNND